MAVKRRKFQLGIRLKGSDQATTLEGELRLDPSALTFKAFVDGAEREIVTADQAQTLENKSIDADNNTISNLETDNLKAGVLVTDISAATSDTELPSALAVKTAIDGQNEASEIEYDNTSSGLAATNVQDAIDEVETRVDTAESGLSDHLIDAVDAHDASAISNTPSGNLVATDVQGALDELQTEMDGRPTVTETMQNKTLDSTNTISGSIENPTRSDVKQDTEANLVTYAATATDGQFVFATDTQKAYQIIDNALEAIGGGGSTSFEISQAAHGLSVGNGIYHNGTIYVQAQANDADTLAYHVVIEVIDANTFIAADFGRIEVLAHGFTVGQYYFQSEAVAGSPVTTEPVSGYSNPLFYVEDANTLQIKCLRPSPVGDSIDLDELADVSVPAPTDGQALIYDNGNARWEAKDIATSASDISYDNSSSGLTAVEAQSAIDEVEARVDTAEANIISNDTDIRDLDRIKNINYASNPDFNDDISGVTGDTNLIVSQETVAPLRGTGSLKIVKGAVDASTQSVIIDMDSVAIADLSQMLTVSFDIDASDANYADGDAQVRIIKDPSGSPETIRVNGEDIKGGKYTHIAQFQTDHTEVNYALEIYYADSGTSAVELLIDNVQIGPRNVVKGAAMTDWKEYTPTFQGVGTPTLVNMYYKRVGDSIKVIGEFTAGTPSSVEFQLGLPQGLLISNTIDTNQATIVGYMHRNNANETQYTYLATPGDTYVNLGRRNDSSGGSFSPEPATSLIQVSEVISVKFEVPIQGWSSNTILSEDIGNREIVVEGAGNSGTSITADVTDIDFTQIRDTTNSWNGSVFTVPETGEYLLSGITYLSTGNPSMQVRLYKNGAFEKVIGLSGSIAIGFKESTLLEKGDEVSLRLNISDTLANNSGLHHISINKLANPQTILDTATVAARYISTSGQSVAPDDIIEYGTLDYDTHNAYNTSTGVYTVPTSGIYSINAQVLGGTATNYRIMRVRKNGENVDSKYTDANGILDAGVSDIQSQLKLEKGDEITVIADFGGSTIALSVDSTYNVFTIHKIK